MKNLPRISLATDRRSHNNRICPATCTIGIDKASPLRRMLDQNVEVVAGSYGPQDLPHLRIAKVSLDVRLIGNQPGEDMIVIAVVLIFGVGELA